MSGQQTTIQPAAMSVANAGRYLGVSTDTVRRLVRAGAIPHARIGNSVRIRRADLEDYLEAQTSRDWRPVAGRGRSASAAIG